MGDGVVMRDDFVKVTQCGQTLEGRGSRMERACRKFSRSIRREVALRKEVPSLEFLPISERVLRFPQYLT